MDSEFDTTGVITKISDDCCIVSLTVDNVQKSFSFSKFLLYVFGLQCEGLMTNILDEGTEVEVRYRFSVEKIPFIVAVWYGEKPDHLLKDSEELKAYYDQKGCVIGTEGDNLLVRNDNFNHTVLISKEVTFRDGYRIKDVSGLLIDEAVTFDAIPFETKHPTGALYQATCAWVGHTPKLFERFGLHTLALLDDTWDNENPTGVVHGIVAVIPNEIIAFADTKSIQNNCKVMLMRSSFAGCGSVKEVVKVGDKLCMTIRYEYLFNNCKQWFAVRAWKDGEVVDEVVQAVPAGEDGSSVEELAKMEKGASSVVDVGVSSEDLDYSNGMQVLEPCVQVRKRTWTRQRKHSIEKTNEPLETKHLVEAKESCSEMALQTETRVPNVKFDVNSEVLVNNPPLSGVISIISKDSASILYEGLKIFVGKKVLYKDGKLCAETQFVLLLTTEIHVANFEAVKTRKKSGFSHEATCVWVGKKPSVSWLKTGCIKPHEREGPPGKNKTTMIESVVKFDQNSPVLLNDPPLSGFLTRAGDNFAEISYERLKIFCSNEDFYYEGKCFALLNPGVQLVHFEAIKTIDRFRIRKGFSHDATCAWVGNKPSLTVIARALPPMKFSLLGAKRTFIGVVRKFCLPKVALVVVEGETSVCLHVNAFGCHPKKDEHYAGGKKCINHFVKLKDRVEFKVTRIPTFFNVLSATDVKILGAETSSKDDSDYHPDDTSKLQGASSVVPLSRKGTQDDASTRDVSPSRILPGKSTPHQGKTPFHTPAWSDEQDKTSRPSSEVVTPLEKNPEVVYKSVLPEKSILQGETPFHATASRDEEQDKTKHPLPYFPPEDVTTTLEKIPGIVYKSVPFKLSRPAVMQKWYIRCTATLKIDINSKVVLLPPTCFSVDYTDSTDPALCTLVNDYVPPNQKTLMRVPWETVSFDGVEKDELACVKRVWPNVSSFDVRHIYPELSTVFLKSELSLQNVPFSLPNQCRGKIVAIPLYDSAIAEAMGRFRVLITLESLVSEIDINPTSATIDAYLTVGDYVNMEIKMFDTALKAERCWKAVKLRDSDGNDQVEETVGRKLSWSDKWVESELFKTGQLKRENGHYFLMSSNLNPVTLDTPQGFFVNGKSTDLPDDLHGQNVMFHVAHKGLGTPNISYSVPFAWIGEIPKALNILIDRIAVPEGVVCNDWFYEGFVEDFPLPTRAICRIGAVPVSVHIGGVRAGIFHKAVDVGLVEGNLVRMRVCERKVNGLCCLESSETSAINLSQDVIANFNGIVSSLPRPVGKITAASKGLGDIEVCFDLASVQIPDGMGLARQDVFNWFKYLNNTIKVGTRVYFTAVKYPSKFAQYRALRVWIDESTFSGCSEKDSVPRVTTKAGKKEASARSLSKSCFPS